MVHLPQEILDNVFLNLWNTEQPTTERFHNVPKISIRTILNCRLVARRWFDSKALTSVFVGVLSLTPFVWYNHRLPALEEISEIPKYSCYFSGAITICGMDLGLVTLKDHDRWGPGRDELDKENSVTHYLVHLLRRFSWIEHFRYYPIHPNCLDGTWPNWEVTDSDRTSLETCFQGGPDRSRYGYPALDEGEYSWQGVQKESQWIFPKIMEAFEESHVWLSTLESPLLGNRASHCAITFGTALPETEENLYFGRDLFRWFPRGLKRVAITITQHIRRPLLISDGLEELKNLEYLDITLSRSPPHCSRWGGPFDEPFRLSYSFLSNMSYQLEKLKEFRLMADQQHLFDEHDIIHSMKIFPNVKKLAFAHILLDEPGNWSSLLQRLATLNLEELRLLDPRNLVCDYPQRRISHAHLRHVYPSQSPRPKLPGTQNTDYRMFKYVEDDHLLLAAQKVRLIDTNSLWTAETHPGLSRTFEYPGFAIFEKGEDDC